MQGYKLYYYWDTLPGQRLPPYIELCLESWQRHAGAQNITRVSLDNIMELSEGVLSPAQLRLFTPPQRSDAAMAVLMRTRRGLFMDADTVLLPTFDAARYLAEPKPTMYAVNDAVGCRPMLAFLANPGGENGFMNEWSACVVRQIKKEQTSVYRRARRLYRTLKGKSVHVSWSYLGNAILDEIVKHKGLREAVSLVDSEETGFLPLASLPDYGAAVFIKYWFSKADELDVTDHRDGVVALQNSWIPQAFKALGKSDVLAHHSRLGRLLQHAVRENIAGQREQGGETLETEIGQLV